MINPSRNNIYLLFNKAGGMVGGAGAAGAAGGISGELTTTKLLLNLR